MTSQESTPHQVWVVVYIHKHGENINVYATQEKAEAELAKVVRGYWEEIANNSPGSANIPATPPTDDAEAIEIYFENHYSETANITMCEVVGE